MFLRNIESPDQQEKLQLAAVSCQFIIALVWVLIYCFCPSRLQTIRESFYCCGSEFWTEDLVCWNLLEGEKQKLKVKIEFQQTVNQFVS